MAGAQAGALGLRDVDQLLHDVQVVADPDRDEVLGVVGDVDERVAGKRHPGGEQRDRPFTTRLPLER
jgi:hypothetical protein